MGLYDNYWRSKEKNISIIRQMRHIALIEFGYRLNIQPVKKLCSGIYNCDRLVQINLSQLAMHVWQDFFHELGHHRNYVDGKYYKYESSASKSQSYIDEVDRAFATIRYGLKAEQCADSSGKKLMKKYRPQMKWDSDNDYSDDRVKKAYRENFITPEREYLEENGYFE